MARDGFVIYHELLDFLTPFGDAERGRLLTAMLEYSISGEAPELRGNERFIWPAVQAKIDKDKESYAARCETNRNNRQQSSTTVDDGQRNAPTRTRTITRTGTIEKEKVLKEKKSSEFTTPTLEEVEAYCAERNSPVNAKTFFDYFEEGGWTDSKGNPVRNWKQKLITWEKGEQKKSPGKQKSSLDEDLEMIRRWADDHK